MHARVQNSCFICRKYRFRRYNFRFPVPIRPCADDFWFCVTERASRPGQNFHLQGVWAKFEGILRKTIPQFLARLHTKNRPAKTRIRLHVFLCCIPIIIMEINSFLKLLNSPHILHPVLLWWKRQQKESQRFGLCITSTIGAK